MVRRADITVALLAAGWALAAAGTADAQVLWPDSPGYTGSDYIEWIVDGPDPELDGATDILSVDLARDRAASNAFFFFRIHVREAKQSQLTSIAHALYLDIEGDGTNDFVLYNPTTSEDHLELVYWSTQTVPPSWQDTPSPPAHDYRGLGYASDASILDDFTEFSLPAAHIGDPPTLYQAAATGRGALNMDGDTNNIPDPSVFSDVSDVVTTESSHSNRITAIAVTGSVVTLDCTSTNYWIPSRPRAAQDPVAEGWHDVAAFSRTPDGALYRFTFAAPTNGLPALYRILSTNRYF